MTGNIMYYTIYKITNTVNNKIYIGKHQTNDLDDGYMGSGLILKRAIEKYGIDKFTKEILYVFDNEEQMNNMEKEIVNEEFILREDVYNLKEGGQGGFDYVNSMENAKEMKIKGREKSKKVLIEKYGVDYLKVMGKKGNAVNSKKYGSDIIKRMHGINGWIGKRHTEESKQKISEINKIRQKGDKNSQYGTCWITHAENKQNLKIKKEDTQKWLDEGWTLGRKFYK